MKTIKAIELLDRLQSDVRHLLLITAHLKSEDPGLLLEQPGPGKWTAIQAIEHLNTYGRYYIPAIEKALQSTKPASGYFRSGWLGGYFTKMMRPTAEGEIKNKMKAPKGHRPSPLLDPATVLAEFESQQHQLLDLLQRAKAANIGTIRVPISLSKLIRLKLGDVFQFLIVHEQRHFIQAGNTLAAVKKAIGHQHSSFAY